MANKLELIPELLAPTGPVQDLHKLEAHCQLQQHVWVLGFAAATDH